MFARPCVQACSCALLVRIHADVSPRTRHACQVQSCKDSREATCSTITLHTSLFHIGGEWLRSARRARSLAAPGLGSSLKAQPNTLPHPLLSQGIAPILTLTYGANSGPKDPKIMADWICNWNLLHSGKIGVVLHLHNCENKTYFPMSSQEPECLPSIKKQCRIHKRWHEGCRGPELNQQPVCHHGNRTTKIRWSELYSCGGQLTWVPTQNVKGCNAKKGWEKLWAFITFRSDYNCKNRKATPVSVLFQM